MSRIGKMPIHLPAGVEVKVSPENVITVKGPKGELTQKVDPAITAKMEDGVLTFERPSDSKEHKAMHGLYRALVANMVKGVSEGFEAKLQLVGVAYKAEAQGQLLTMSLGYSHNIVFEFPKEIEVTAVTEKGKDPLVTLKCNDKQLLGQVCNKIRSYRKPEPYKGKGIRFVGEEIRKKAGKSADK